MGKTLNGAPGLDIDAEVSLAERKVKELHADPDVSDKAITRALKDLGIQRYFVSYLFQILLILDHMTLCLSYSWRNNN